jgi:3-methyl-2-oxobutanoate hydroxymethyltransferase
LKDAEMAGYLEEQENTIRANAVTLTRLQQMESGGEKIAMLTCYDASFASVMDKCGVDMLLVGDSLGNVCQGHSTTLGVTIADIAYHTACVARGNRTAFLAADMPFGTYGTPEAAFENAVKLMQAGAHMVKLEGGVWLSDTVRFLSTRGIPVFAHLGLTPQYVHQLGGFKVQGKSKEGAQRVKDEALALQAAGAAMMLLEAIPASLGKAVTDALPIPTIGIGAGPDCSGQVLVMHDMLDVFPGKKARFVRNFMEGQSSIENAVRNYVTAVKDKSFPSAEHCF